MGGPFADPLSVTPCQGWHALSSYLKIVRGGGEVGGGRVGKECLSLFLLKLESENLPLVFSFQPGRKS